MQSHVGYVKFGYFFFPDLLLHDFVKFKKLILSNEIKKII